MDKHYQNLYASLNRLQNFPLDLTCVYETLAKAQTYAHKKKTKAYAGQVLVVYGDPENNGIYAVISGADTDSGLTLQKSADAKDLDALKKEIDESIKAEIKKLSGEFKDLQGQYDELEKTVEEFKKKLNEDFFNSVEENKKEIEGVKKDLNDNIDAINKTISDTKAELNDRINRLYDDGDLDSTLNSIKEIADWIRDNQDESMPGLAMNIKTVSDKLDRHEEDTQKQFDKIAVDIASIKNNTDKLSIRVDNIKDDIADIRNDIAHLNINREHAYSTTFNSTETAEAIKLADVPAGRAISRIIIEILEPAIDRQNEFSISAKSDGDSINTILISNEDDSGNDYDEPTSSYIDVKCPGKYIYNIDSTLSNDEDCSIIFNKGAEVRCRIIVEISPKYNI